MRAVVGPFVAQADRMTKIGVALLAAFVASSSLLAGCSASDQQESTDDTADLSDQEADALAKTSANQTAYDFFVRKGLKSFQAAGIVGNLDQESGMSPTIAEYGGGPGRGIAQWSVGGRWDSDRNDNVRSFASSQGTSRWSLTTQLDFIWYELTNFDYGYKQLRASTDVTDATIVFQDRYEECGTCASRKRIAYAKAVLRAYGP